MGIKDESGCCHTRHLMAGIRNFNEMLWSIKKMEKFLNEIGKDYGLSAKSGDKICWYIASPWW